MSARVLVAHESDTIRETVRRLVRDAGYEVEAAGDGESALALVKQHPPEVMVIDVALPRVLGYEVVDRVRRQGLPTRSILVASVYNRTGYKRRPTSLYGADDYIEQHHIPDQLLMKIAKLLPEESAPRIGPPDPTEGAEIRRAGEGRLRIALLGTPGSGAGSIFKAVASGQHPPDECDLDIGLDQARFASCLASGRHDRRVAEDQQNALATGGRGTPWSIVVSKSGKTYPLSGAQPYAAVKRLVDLALEDK